MEGEIHSLLVGGVTRRCSRYAPNSEIDGDANGFDREHVDILGLDDGGVCVQEIETR